MKKAFLTLASVLLCISCFAQKITSEELKDIKKSFGNDKQTVATQNLLTNDSDIKSMTLNHAAQTDVDHFFKYEVNVSGITDQQSSGRCWMFTSMNVLRPSIMKKYNVAEFDFSHNYLYFWDMFEKSNLFLENIIATSDESMDDREVVNFFSSPVGDGGVWNLFHNIASKYGAVPKEVMKETAHSNNTSQMGRYLNERLRVGGMKLREMAEAKASEKDLLAEKIVILKEVYRLLALCLGEPPVDFTWRYEDKDGVLQTVKSTPKDFYAGIIPANYDKENLIMIMNDPTREFYKVYEIKNYRNTIEGFNWTYLNLPNEVIKEAAIKSIKNNEAMYVSCDVGKQFNGETGILHTEMYDPESLLGIDLTMDKKSRILSRQSGSAHAMTLISVDTDENEIPTKWEFENSWGAQAGNKGCLTFTDKWFNEYLFRIVIDKKYLDSKSVKALESKPIQLPVWDYMF